MRIVTQSVSEPCPAPDCSGTLRAARYKSGPAAQCDRCDSPKVRATDATGSVSAVVPTYNEREVVVDTVDRIRAELDGTEHEVLVVDDDSPDGTWRVVRREYSDDPRVRCVRRTADPGLSAAILDGIRESVGDNVVVVDADGQHPPSRILDIATELEATTADLVMGSRHTDAGSLPEEWPVKRRVMSRGAKWLAWMFVPAATRTTDPMSGFFGVRRDVVDGDAEWHPRGYKIALELMQRADVDTVAEVPYEFHERRAGESNMDTSEVVKYAEHLMMVGADAVPGLRRVRRRLAIPRAIELASVVWLAIAITAAYATPGLDGGEDLVIAGVAAVLAVVTYVGAIEVVADA